MQQRVDLRRGAGVDRVRQEVGLAPVVGVDGARREPGRPRDVLDPGLLVALVDEDLDRGGNQPLPGRLHWCDGHRSHDNDHYPSPKAAG